MTDVVLSAEDRAALAGERGEALALAMRIVTGVARVRGAERLVDIASAHIDSGLYHGVAGLDFAHRLVSLGAHVRVPTTMNVGSLDLLHPGLVRNHTAHEREVTANGRALMQAYLAMGARPTWTCAPYQLDQRPGLGEHVAWAESNAIAFCNSVLGARTDRYGDFLDICAAVTGRAPLAGFHLDAARRATAVVDVSAVAGEALAADLTWPLLGCLVGERYGTAVVAVTGVADPSAVTEDQLKGFGAAGASAGGVAMFHVVGVTPEAPDLESACGSATPTETWAVTTDDLVEQRRRLSTARGTHLDAVSIGTPHASLNEIASLATELQRQCTGQQRVHGGIDFYISTGRTVFAQAQTEGLVAAIERRGVRFVTDTCTYVTPVLRPGTRTVMTNSGKWAHYAPGNLGIDVVMASLRECVASALGGKVVTDDAWW